MDNDMTGEVLLRLVPLVFVLLGILIHRYLGPSKRWLGKVFIVFASIMFAILMLQLGLWIREHRRITGVPAEQVAGIQIGRQQFTDPNEVNSIIGSLQNAEMWTGNVRYIYTRTVILKLRLVSGSELECRARYHPPTGGALIEYRYGDDSGYFHLGNDLSRSLSEVLQRLGSPLPTEQEHPGRR